MICGEEVAVCEVLHNLWMQEKLVKMTSDYRMDMANKRGRPVQHEQGGDSCWVIVGAFDVLMIGCVHLD